MSNVRLKDFLTDDVCYREDGTALVSLRTMTFLDKEGFLTVDALRKLELASFIDRASATRAGLNRSFEDVGRKTWNEIQYIIKICDDTVCA